MGWSLTERLLALRMNLIDRRSLAELTPEERRIRILNWSACCSPNGASLFAIVHVPNVWPNLNKTEQQTHGARVRCKEAWNAEPQPVQDYFAFKTAKLRGGSLDVVYEVLDKYSGHVPQLRKEPKAQFMAPAGASNDQMSLLHRTILIGTTPFDARELIGLNPKKQNARAKLWASNSLSMTGRTLFAFKLAPDYERAAVANGEFFPPSQFVDSRWAQLSAESRDQYSGASVQVRGGHFPTLVRVMTRMLGCLPDLVPFLDGAGESDSDNEDPNLPKSPGQKGSFAKASWATTSTSFISRLSVAGIPTHAAEQPSGMSGKQQDPRVVSWCRTHIHSTGRTLFVLRKAPDYIGLSDKRKSRESQTVWSAAAWQKLEPNKKRIYKTAAGQLRANECDLNTFVAVMTKVLGPLKDLTTIFQSDDRNDDPNTSTSHTPTTMRDPAPSSISTSADTIESSDSGLEQAASDSEAASAVNHFSQWLAQEVAALPMKENRVIKPMKTGKKAAATPEPMQCSTQKILGHEDQDKIIRRVDSAIGSSVSGDYLSARSSPTLSFASTRTGQAETAYSVPQGQSISISLSQPVVQIESQTTVLDTLVPRHKRSVEMDELIDQVLEALKQRVFPRADKTLVGRTADQFRIDYNPMTPDITGIWSRLEDAATTHDAHDFVEALLRPLVEWNSESMFPELKPFSISNPISGRGASAYRSAWSFHDSAHARVAPVKVENAGTVIEIVYESIRARYRTMKGDDFLGLLDLEKYLDQLVDCFDDSDATPEQYDDQIERVLYRFELDHNCLEIL